MKYSALRQDVVRCNYQNTKEEILQANELKAYRTNFNVTLTNSNILLDNFLIYDSLNNVSSIKEILNDKDSNVLICRFSKRHCASCVRSSIEMLSSWVDSIGKNRIIYLSSNRNMRLFKKTILSYGIQNTNVYDTPELNIPVEELGFPYYLVVDNSLRVL